MMFRLLILFFAILPLFVNGQSNNLPAKDLDKLDSLQFYSSEKSLFEFSMHSKLQGFFWDSIFYDSKPSIEVKIVNDSKDTLINYYQCRDSRIYWMEKKGKYGDTLLPGQSISVISLWPDREPTGTFDSPIRLKYKIGDSIYINRIEVWGSVYPSSDKIISKPIKLISYAYGMGCYETIRYLKKDGTIKKEILFDKNGRRTIIIYKRNKKKIKTKYSKKWVMNSLPQCGKVIEIKE